MKPHYEMLVLGGGPAGLTAALYAARAKLSTAVIEERLPGGQVRSTHRVDNWPGFPEGIAGRELAARFEQHAERMGAEIARSVEVTKIHLRPGDLWVELDEETRVSADAVILAVGCTPRKLGVPGEDELSGHGISYCATCDGAFFEGKRLVVVGGGNSAVEESIFLTRYAREVAIVHQFAELQAEKSSQEAARANPRIRFVLQTEPRGFVERDGAIHVEVEHLDTKRRETLETDGVFVFVGQAPRTDRLAEWLELDRGGYVPTDEMMRTKVPGVFAAGDIRPKPYRQITTAVGDGTIAALSAERYLIHKQPWPAAT